MVRYNNSEKWLLEQDILLFFQYKYGIPKDTLFDNEVYYPVYESESRYNFIRGGRGSGKSFEIEGKLPIVYTSCLPFCRFAMIRQVYNSIKTSQFQELVDYINLWNLGKYFKINTSPMRITHKETGNYIVFAGMDKPDSFKSIKDVTHVVFGEAFQIANEEGVDKIDKSIRTPLVDNHKLYFVFNPDNKHHFIYHKYYNPDTEAQYQFYREKALFLKTTYRDNKFVSKNFADLLEADRIANPDRAKVDADGEFGDIKPTGLFYANFDSEEAVRHKLKEEVYNPKDPLYLSFDFNVYPYISLNIHQLRYNSDFNQLEFCTIDEICLHEKDFPQRSGKVKETVLEFLNKYDRHEGNIVVLGDKSGSNRKTNSIPDYATIFLMLKATPRIEYIDQVIDGRKRKINPYPEYERRNCSFKVIDATIKSNNPSLIARELFFKRLHAGTLSVLPPSTDLGTKGRSGESRAISRKYSGAKIVHLIDSRCRYLIKDYSEVRRTEKGTKDDRNKELTHTSDNVDYCAVKLFESEFNKILFELKK